MTLNQNYPNGKWMERKGSLVVAGRNWLLAEDLNWMQGLCLNLKAMYVDLLNIQ